MGQCERAGIAIKAVWSQQRLFVSLAERAFVCWLRGKRGASARTRDGGRRMADAGRRFTHIRDGAKKHA